MFEKIIEDLVKVIPLKALFERLGLDENVSAICSFILIAISGWLFVRIYKIWKLRYNVCKKALADITPQFDLLTVKRARKYYIQTQYQNVSPSRQEEPGFTHKYTARQKLISFFLKTGFNQTIENDKFYLILADSGMGKTTFMINLYFSFYRLVAKRRKLKMRLYRFSNLDTMELIRLIPKDEAQQTILLLDALDEDLGIISSNPNLSDTECFQKRVDEIIEIVRVFAEVVITCRTQYFPGQEDDPFEIKVKRPDEKGFYTLSKLYLSPFTEKEVGQYLNKKFGIFRVLNRSKKKRALDVVLRSRNLVMRPMLLSYIDYLIEDNARFESTYEIYHTLIDKWLVREVEKRKGLAERLQFKKALLDLSRAVSMRIYENWRSDGKMFLTKSEAMEVASRYQIELKPEEITGQSLLTCDGVGNWKFAHKSIFEFFLANEVHTNPALLRSFSFKGMDMAQKFYDELQPSFIELTASKYFSNINIPHWKHSKRAIYILSEPVFEDNIQFTNTTSRISKSTFGKKIVFSKREAIKFCDSLNKKFGYKPIYEGKIDDATENLISKLDLRNIKGFRLPTDNELLLFNDIINGSLGRPVTRNPADFEIRQFELGGEWSYLEEGGVLAPCRVKMPRMSQAFTISGERSSKDEVSFRHLFIDRVSEYDGKNTKGLFMFRIVYVP